MKSLFSHLSEEKVHIIIVIKKITRCENKYQDISIFANYNITRSFILAKPIVKPILFFSSVEITGIAQRLDLADIYLSNEFMKHTFDAL